MTPNRKKIVLDWKGNFRFEAKTEKGLKINFDAPIDHGGEASAPSPMETLLASLAACTSYDVVSVLKKKRQNITGYSIKVEAERAAEPPTVYTKIDVKYIIRGKNIAKEAVERAIQLSTEKYCPIEAMIKKTAEITSSYEIIEE
ncbi:MAG: OsmC family protein [Candidatus Bathyarchaeota archaeon]|nr:OsmC family protein [Candidatus Bathyarchaeota archaeon]